MFMLSKTMSMMRNSEIITEIKEKLKYAFIYSMLLVVLSYVVGWVLLRTLGDGRVKSDIIRCRINHDALFYLGTCSLPLHCHYEGGTCLSIGESRAKSLHVHGSDDNDNDPLARRSKMHSLAQWIVAL